MKILEDNIVVGFFFGLCGALAFYLLRAALRFLGQSPKPPFTWR